MLSAFVVMLASTVVGIVWQFVSLNTNSWAESGHLSAAQLDSIFLGVDLPIGIAAAISWLLVALAVLRIGRGAGQFGPAPYAGQGNYPTTGAPGFANPQPGYAQPGYQQPGYPQPGTPQPGYAQPDYQQQPGYPQPGTPQPGAPLPGSAQPGYPQPGSAQPGSAQPGYPQPGYQPPNPGGPATPPQ
jgi:hypothetical protein